MAFTLLPLGPVNYYIWVVALPWAISNFQVLLRKKYKLSQRVQSNYDVALPLSPLPGTRASYQFQTQNNWKFKQAYLEASHSPHQNNHIFWENNSPLQHQLKKEEIQSIEKLLKNNASTTRKFVETIETFLFLLSCEVKLQKAVWTPLPHSPLKNIVGKVLCLIFFVKSVLGPYLPHQKAFFK